MPKTTPKASAWAAPMYVKERGGHMRWEPTPKHRKHGVTLGHDFKNPATGEWLGRDAVERDAAFITEAVEAWCKHRTPFPPQLAHLAPSPGALTPRNGVTPTPPAFIGANPALTIGTLVDGFLADPKPGLRVLMPATRKQYQTCMHNLLKAVADNALLTLDELRQQDIVMLQRPANAGDRFHLSEAYDTLYARAPTMAYVTFTICSTWFNWMARKKSVYCDNPCKLILRQPVGGRIFTYEPEEIDALVWAAEWIGLPSLADMIIIGVDLTWEQQSLVSLTWDQLDEEGYAVGARQKTGISGFPRLSDRAIARLQQIKQRWVAAGGAANALPEHVFLFEAPTRRECCRLHYRHDCLVCQGRPWKADTLRQYWTLIREIAAARAWEVRGDDIVEAKDGLPRQYVTSERRDGSTVKVSYPHVMAGQFRDLRDTGITRCREAGMTYAEITTRSRHSEETVRRICEESYEERKQRMADAATDKLNAYHELEDTQRGSAEIRKLKARVNRLHRIA